MCYASFYPPVAISETPRIETLTFPYVISLPHAEGVFCMIPLAVVRMTVAYRCLSIVCLFARSVLARPIPTRPILSYSDLS